ncbi:hypothetical protein [Limosilactobacillus pontis]|uniref:hypothetical protein n=1 Tax=Limosilactobacillus pontis TaxID=35787 RepID=UPI00128F8DC3|nr:hypothetical protein [Limosilactobacillus pontis]QFV01311.1 hypothetical protein LP475_06180 [Limosilactobacillus pontis]
MIENAASGQSSNLLNQQYFGHYPNTFFLLWIEHFIFLLFGQPKFSNFITLLGGVNLLFLDTAFAILIRSANKIYKNKTITLIVALVSWILIVLSPYFVSSQ